MAFNWRCKPALFFVSRGKIIEYASVLMMVNLDLSLAQSCLLKKSIKMSVSIGDNTFIKKFMLPMNSERLKKLEKDFPALLQRGYRIDGAGLAKKLAELQYLLDDVIIDKSRDMHYPRGSISIFDWSKGPIPFDFSK
jgi:hypothetical protein